MVATSFKLTIICCLSLFVSACVTSGDGILKTIEGIIPSSDSKYENTYNEKPKIIRKSKKMSGGKIVDCTIQEGQANFTVGWLPIVATEFKIRRGNTQNISLSSKRATDNVSINVKFSEGGQKMVFCPVFDAKHKTRLSCYSMYALDEDYNLGFKRTFDVPNAVRGSVIKCKH